MGIGGVGFGLKALLTPPRRSTWSLAGEVFASTAIGDENALVGTWNPEGFDLGGRLDLTFSPTRTDRARSVRAHANAGYLARTGEFDAAAWEASSAGPTPQRSVLHGDLVMYGAAVEIPAPRSVTFFTEWSGEYDVDAEARFEDNPMRVTPGIRWAARGGSFALTAGWDVSLASEEAGPSNQMVAGLTFGGYSTKVTGQVVGVVRDAETGQPIPGARVTARNPGAAPAVANEEGRFASKLEEGYVVLDFSADGYTPKTRVVEVRGHDDVALRFPAHQARSVRHDPGTRAGRQERRSARGPRSAEWERNVDGVRSPDRLLHARSRARGPGHDRGRGARLSPVVGGSAGGGGAGRGASRLARTRSRRGAGACGRRGEGLGLRTRAGRDHVDRRTDRAHHSRGSCDRRLRDRDRRGRVRDHHREARLPLQDDALLARRAGARAAGHRAQAASRNAGARAARSSTMGRPRSSASPCRRSTKRGSSCWRIPRSAS